MNSGFSENEPMHILPEFVGEVIHANAFKQLARETKKKQKSEQSANVARLNGKNTGKKTSPSISKLRKKRPSE